MPPWSAATSHSRLVIQNGVRSLPQVVLISSRRGSPLSASYDWSQNLGHNQMLTTLCSYGKVPPERQAEVLKRQCAGAVGQDADRHEGPDAGTTQTVLAHLAKTVSNTA